jgi:hypothetical protein
MLGSLQALSTGGIMKAKVVRLLLLAAVCTVGLWPPAVSFAWDACPGQSCPFWRDVCEIGGGTFVQTNIGRCVQEDSTTVVLWHAVCTAPTHDPWTMDCTGI